MNIKQITIITAIVLAQSCNSPVKETLPTQTIVSNTEIPFVIAEKYFVKNTYNSKGLSLVKMSSAQELEDIFGMGTVMGPDGKPTEINFDNQYAVALIAPETDSATTISVDKLTQIDSTINLTYTKHVGEKQTYTIRPFQLIIIDKKNQGNLIF